MITRTDSYALAAEEVERFRLRGCGVLHDVLSEDEAARYLPALRDYVLQIKAEGAGIDAAPFGNAAKGNMRTSYNLAEAPEIVQELVRLPKLGEIAAQLLGVDVVRVLHFCGHFKPSGGGPTPWHQDLAYIPLDTDKVVSLWIALTDVTPEMGPLVFAEGSHKSGLLDGLPAGHSFRLVQNEPMRRGDVSMHAGWTMHGAAPNRSGVDREAVTICYFADGAHVKLGTNAMGMQSFMSSCFAGLTPGDVAAGPLNPVVYRRSA
jgi:hypothetical protein